MSHDLSLSERDCFYQLMNIESHLDFLHTARKRAEEYLADARKKLNSPGVLPKILERFPFSYDAFNGRLDKLFNELATETKEKLTPGTQKYLDHFAYWTKYRIRERLIQFAPFNITDGAWLQNSTRAGTVNTAQAMLFGIWADEVGNGIESQNHSNIYRDLLNSTGEYFPESYTKDFAQDPRFLDSAFSVPVFQLAISQFPSAFFPEIIGMTLWLEWSSPPELQVIVASLKANGFDPLFYNLHVAIDNPINGHGGKAKQIVGLYLDEMKKNGADLQTHWQRIWDGFVAFQTVGTLAADLRSKLDNAPQLEAEMIALVKRFSDKAKMMHGEKVLNDSRTNKPMLLNDYFDDPRGLLDALISNNFVIPGKPKESPFFDLLKFGKSMYRVFSDDDIGLMEKWINSLAPAHLNPQSTRSPGQAMERLLDEFREIQKGVPSHAIHKLSGPDPANPGQTKEAKVAWWFDTKNASTAQLMKALASDSRYIVLGKPNESPLVLTFLTLQRSMGARLGKANIEIIKNWIEANCPDPPEEIENFALFFDTEVSNTTEPKRRLLGMGAVH